MRNQKEQRLLQHRYNEIKENKKGKVRDLFHQTRQIKEKAKARVGVLKEKYGNTLARQDEIKRRWKEYTEKLNGRDMSMVDHFKEEA